MQITLNSYKTCKFNTVFAEFSRQSNTIAVSLGNKNGDYTKDEKMTIFLQILAFITTK